MVALGLAAGCDDRGDAVDTGGAGSGAATSGGNGGASQGAEGGGGAGGTGAASMAGGTSEAGAGGTSEAGAGGTSEAGAAGAGEAGAGGGALCTVTAPVEDEGGRTPPGLPCGRLGLPESASGLLLDVGHSTSLVAVTLSGDRLLSSDYAGRWVLWDRAAQTLLARGLWGGPTRPALARDTLIVALPPAEDQVALEVRSAVDGSVLATLTPEGFASAMPYGVAQDGSYVWAATDQAIWAWSPDGTLLASAEGDYATARVFAAPGELRIADGDAGPSVIEKLSIATGSSTTLPILGGFHSWFVDGGRFLTNVSSTFRVYASASGTQEALFTTSNASTALGHDDYLILKEGYFLVSDPTTPLPVPYVEATPGDGTILSMTQIWEGVSIVEAKDSGELVASEVSVPNSVVTLLAADSESDSWAWGGQRGELFDGSDLERPLSCGEIQGIATASTGRTAVSTAVGGVLLFDPAAGALEFSGQMDINSYQIAVSADGTILAASGDLGNAHRVGHEPSLRVYELPSGTLLKAWPSGEALGGFPKSFSMGSEGTRFGLTLAVSGVFETTVYDLEGEANLIARLDARGLGYLSPSGSGVTLPTDTSSVHEPWTANIYQDGQLVSAIFGVPLGFLDEEHLLANVQEPEVWPPVLHASVYDLNGELQPGPVLPELTGVAPLPENQVYSTTPHGIYSLTTGELSWSCPTAVVGSAGGGYAVYKPAAATQQLIAAPYPML